MKRLNFSLLMLTFTLFSIYKSSHSDDMNTPDMSFHHSLNCLLDNQPAKIRPVDLTIGTNDLFKVKNIDHSGKCAYSLLTQELNKNLGRRFFETKKVTI